MFAGDIFLANVAERGYARSVTKSVLAIDDDPAFLRLLDLQLKKSGFDATLAKNTAEAFEAMKKKKFQLVITDMRMPLSDGYDVVSAIKELYPQMPILLTTAYEVNQRVRSALRFESVWFLRKPFELTQLREAIATLFPAELSA